MRFWALAILVVSLLGIDGCGGGSGGGSTTGPPAITITISPPSVTIRGGGTQQFIGQAFSTPNSAVTWSVNTIPGGNASVGTIDASGLYTAPIPAPSSNVVQVTATSVADPTQEPIGVRQLF